MTKKIYISILAVMLVAGCKKAPENVGPTFSGAFLQPATNITASIDIYNFFNILIVFKVN